MRSVPCGTSHILPLAAVPNSSGRAPRGADSDHLCDRASYVIDVHTTLPPGLALLRSLYYGYMTTRKDSDQTFVDKERFGDFIFIKRDRKNHAKGPTSLQERSTCWIFSFAPAQKSSQQVLQLGSRSAGSQTPSLTPARSCSMTRNIAAL